MKFKNIILTTCIAATTLLIESSLNAQIGPTATPGAAPKFGPEKTEDDSVRKGKFGKHNPEERLAKMKEVLALTPEQETKIRDILKFEGEKMRAQRQANKGNKPTPEDRKAKMKAARAEVEASIKAVLTPEQISKMESFKKNRQEHGPGPKAPETQPPTP